MKQILIIVFIICSWAGQSLLVGQTNRPIILFKDLSAHISQSGHPMKLPDGADSFPEFGGIKSKTNKGVAISGWEEGFRKKFEENIQYMVNQLESDLVQVKLQSQGGGGKANIEVNIYVFCIHDCHPCSGGDAVSEEYLATFLEFVDVRTNEILHIDKAEATFIIEGEPNLKESVDRAWSEFLRSFIKDEKLKGIIKNVTNVTDAKITFRAKDSSDKLPMKADGKKRGVVKIDLIQTEKVKNPVGEIEGNPLTEFELSCDFGKLIDKDGAETKKIKFFGTDYMDTPNFEFDYVVYNCDEQCEKYDNFTLKLKGQNGTNLVREIKKHKEEFECYGYTISLVYSESNEVTGTTKITATWECVKISFGKPGEEPVVMDSGAAMGGVALDTKGDPLSPPYTIPMETFAGLTYLSAPIKNNTPSSYSLNTSPSGLLTYAKNLQINFGEDYLTNPPELILVKTPLPGKELCGGIIPPGVYLEWQFDIWGNLPDLGNSQLYSPAATMCPLLSNIPNSTIARVPEHVIPLMKEGKAFSFSNGNNFGTYTITGTPQQQ